MWRREMERREEKRKVGMVKVKGRGKRLMEVKGR